MTDLLAHSLAFVDVLHPSPLQLDLGILVHWTVAFHVHVPSITVNQQHHNLEHNPHILQIIPKR